MARKRDEVRWNHWRGVLADHHSSGLSVSEFCRRRELNPSSFYRWRKTLAGLEKPGSENPGSASPTFVAVSLPAATTSLKQASSSEELSRCDAIVRNQSTHFQVSLPNGIRVDVPPEFNATALLGLLQAVSTVESIQGSVREGK